MSATTLGGDWFNSHTYMNLSKTEVLAIENASDVRVILRPSDAAARGTLRTTRILDGGDIVLQTLTRSIP